MPDGVRLEHVRRMPLGHKRNYACSVASGDIICHWDDDDWSDPLRIAQQVDLLLSSDADLVGYHSMFFADERCSRAWVYFNSVDYALGTSFCYRAAFWDRCPFPPVQTGEDGAMLKSARLVTMPANNMMVARLHAQNSSSRPSGEFWHEVDYASLPLKFREQSTVAMTEGESNA